MNKTVNDEKFKINYMDLPESVNEELESKAIRTKERTRYDNKMSCCGKIKRNINDSMKISLLISGVSILIALEISQQSVTHQINTFQQSISDFNSKLIGMETTTNIQITSFQNQLSNLNSQIQMISLLSSTLYILFNETQHISNYVSQESIKINELINTIEIILNKTEKLNESIYNHLESLDNKILAINISLSQSNILISTMFDLIYLINSNLTSSIDRIHFKLQNISSEIQYDNMAIKTLNNDLNNLELSVHIVNHTIMNFMNTRVFISAIFTFTLSTEEVYCDLTSCSKNVSLIQGFKGGFMNSLQVIVNPITTNPTFGIDVLIIDTNIKIPLVNSIGEIILSTIMNYANVNFVPVITTYGIATLNIQLIYNQNV